MLAVLQLASPNAPTCALARREQLAKEGSDEATALLHKALGARA